MRPGNIPDDKIPTADPAEIVRQYTGFVKYIANRYAGIIRESGAFDFEDLLQAGTVGLLEAQQRYNPTAGKFTTYSFPLIRNAILALGGFRDPERYRPPQPIVSLDKQISEDFDSTLLDSIEDPDILPFDEPIIDQETRKETAEAVRDAVDRIKSDKQREVIRRVYLDGQERNAVAADMGMKVTALYALDEAGKSSLRRDMKLKTFAMPFYHVGISRFNTTWTSATEEAVIWREEHLTDMNNRLAEES